MTEQAGSGLRPGLQNGTHQDVSRRSALTAIVAGMAGDEGEWTPGDITGTIANPFYAINIDEGLALPHEPMISEEEWVRANVKLIKELGPESYLRNLLSVLKGNYPRG
jgi:hypothetical protein